jgi:hypothetical protein
MTDKICIQCGRTSDQAPLIPLHYRNKDYWICPQDLPILIHKPAQLANKLPGLENLAPAEGHHD